MPIRSEDVSPLKDRGPVMGEWQPIETAPRNGEHVFLYDAYSFEATRGIFIGCWARGQGWGSAGWMEQDSGIEYLPTHWASFTALPPAPSSGERLK